MNAIANIKIAMLALGIFTALPHVASADSGVARVVSANPSTLKVLSNGKSYTKLDKNVSFVVKADFEFDTGATGRIKKWSLEPVITHGFGVAAKVPSAFLYKKTVSYAPGKRPKSLDINWSFNMTAKTLEAAAVTMCEHKATALRNQGKSDKYIFGKNHEVKFKVEVDAKVDANGAGSNNQLWEHTNPKFVKVICAKFAGSRLPAAKGGIQAPTNGNAPKKLFLN
jgi:hypothetical protein